MSSTTYKKAKRGRSQSKASVESAVAKVMEEKKNKVPAKYADFYIASTFYQPNAGASVPYAGRISQLNLLSEIARGDESYQRGAGSKKILIKGIQLRGLARFLPGNDNPIAGGAVTVVIVYDKDPVGSTAAVSTDFLASSAGTDDFANSVNVALNNDGTAQRFQVLRRMDIVLHQNNPFQLIDTYIKGNKRPIIYRNGGTGGIADTQTGAVYALVFQQTRWGWSAPADTPATSPVIRVDMNYRIRFHEVL